MELHQAISALFNRDILVTPNQAKHLDYTCALPILETMINSGASNKDIEQFLVEAEKIGEQRMYEIRCSGIQRIITREKRFAILKRQKWRCNNCNRQLKYNLESEWQGEVAHIDHIYPFSDRLNYFNGCENINELANLQALCPNCNLTKHKRKQ